MSLTEVVYKIRSRDYPLSQLTEKNSDLKVIINQTSWDPESRVAKAILTASGSDAGVAAVQEQVGGLFDDYEVILHAKGQVNIKVTANIDTLRKTHNPTAFALEYFGDEGVVDALLIKDGYFNTRVIAASKVNLANMLQEYEKGVTEGLWDDFKLIRIDDFDPEQQVAGAFTENLTQKQLEVIKTALALGFYNTPRDVTLDDLSSIFGISKAAVHNRLQAAERKVISKFFS